MFQNPQCHGNEATRDGNDYEHVFKTENTNDGKKGIKIGCCLRVVFLDVSLRSSLEEEEMLCNVLQYSRDQREVSV